MNFSLTTELPSWYFLFCLAAGFVYSAALYYRDKLLPEVTQLVRNIMAFFRFITVTLISFFLLTPLINTLFREVEKPVIIVAQDNSASLVSGKDSAYYMNTYKEQMNRMTESLGEQFDVRTYSFGDKVKDGFDFTYGDKITDFSTLFTEIESRFSSRNVGAVILASDGLYNQGSSPVYAAANLKIPVYTIALGDTGVRKDLVLSRVLFNRIAYLGNSFSLEIHIDARKCRGAASLLTVREDSLVLFRKELTIPSNGWHGTIPVILNAKSKGIHRYSIQLAAVENEITIHNNSRDIFVEVLESKQKILLAAHAPHPDIAAIKSSVESSLNYEVKYTLAADFTGPVNEYNLVILHQLPSRNNRIPELIKKIKESGASSLFILGSQTDIQAFNNLKTAVTISDNRNRTNESQAIVSPDFSLFTLTDETRSLLPQLPPLVTPFGNYRMTTQVYSLLNQQIGYVKTDLPLLLFGEDGGRKFGVLAGEGIWKWRLHNFSKNSNQDAVNELITKTVQYLSVRENKSRFRVTGKNNFNENESVVFDAEFYNESYELVNKPEVSLSIFNSENKSYPYTFSKTDKAYTLNAGMFPVGTYRYRASVKDGEKVMNASGQFIVSALQLESSETVADHQLLYHLAEKYNGKMFYPVGMDALVKLLKEKEEIKPISFTEKRLRELLNLKVFFFLILLLLTAEWFMRKRSGGY